ncbi:PUA-like domain-containing protein [Neohortaea acidophila]|uniref:PUA-like domain-containing protein n=1 Tax=Neohortaea acidophila TaxID=245834 RepID=A0A6A6Q6C5_9PEZI|nr:PUA-like domain-containing protein [Neohortaea acidophila]KAF2487865.1 PUA-like domain-containing protein [Neohortaea acidophila]
MSRDETLSEKSTAVGLAPYEDARALVRLIQCTQCSRPLRQPVTLPCGNAVCRACLPDFHERANISYPDVPARRRGVMCPFPDCGREHPASDCGVDVILSKALDSIAGIMAEHTMSASMITTIMEEIRLDDTEALDADSEKPKINKRPWSRLVATYDIAAKGQLPYECDINYIHSTSTSDTGRAMDAAVLQEILDSMHREVDCQICYNVLLDPVTTFCGHTLCRKCMARAVDHSLHCPMCRRSLAIPPVLSRHPSNCTLINLLNAMYPETMTSRAEAVATEETGGEGELNTPLFVCTLGFPHQPTLLRVFEPRYRLMIRRCLESNREFGMLMYNRYGEPQGDLGPVHFYHYGTMLYVTNAQPFPDGTSLVETQGAYRFRVKAHDVLDGYSIGSVERVEDVSLAEEERLEAEETALPPAEEGDVAGHIDRMSTQELLELGQDFVRRMQGRSAIWLRQRVLDIYGQPPDDAALFPYWFASVLPISDEEKYKLLPTRTVRERLKITASWIRRIESQRW